MRRFHITSFTVFIYRYLARISLEKEEKVSDTLSYDNIYNHCVCLDHVLYDLEIVDLGHPEVTFSERDESSISREKFDKDSLKLGETSSNRIKILTLYLMATEILPTSN